MDGLDIYSPKKTREQELARLISLIPKEENILYISEQLSNKRLITILRFSNLLLFLFFCQIFLDFFSFAWIFQDFDSIMITILFLMIFIVIGGTTESFFRSNRKDLYLIITETNIFMIIFSKKNNPILLKNPLVNIQYYTIQKRVFSKSYNLIFYDLGEEIKRKKIKRIRDHLMIQKYLDSLFFHFGIYSDQLPIKVSYDLPIVFNISKSEYFKIKKRIKHIYIGFGILTPILVLIGVIIWTSISDLILRLGNLLGFGIVAAIFYGVLGVIYLKVWIELIRYSSIDDQLTINNEEIRSKDAIFPLSPGIMVSGVYLSSRNTTQTPQSPKPSIYCIEIKDILKFDNKRYFGPIDDFDFNFKVLYYQLLKWKNDNGYLYSKDDLNNKKLKVFDSL